jgi:ribonuclease T2
MSTMKKLLILLLFLTLGLFARQELYPAKSCPTFNNMKHTKNSHHVMLETNRRYVILDHHKGQYLILVKGEQPAQRWVDESCFPMEKEAKNSLDAYIETSGRNMNKTENTIHTKKYENSGVSQNNLLALSWHNAFCETHRYKKECKRNVFTLYRSKHRESHFILHGLWPQPANKGYCGVDRKYITMDKYKHWNKLPMPELSKETYESLKKHMPGIASNLHKHEWIKHGTCYGTDAEQYFAKAVSLADQFHQTEVSDFFEKNIGKRVTLKQVRKHFDQSFGTGAGKRVEMRCHKGLVTELWLHLGGESDALGTLLRNGEEIHSACDRGLIDKAGFGR